MPNIFPITPMPTNPFCPLHNSNVPKHRNRELDYRWLCGAPVVTLPPSPYSNTLSGARHTSTLAAFAGGATMGMSCRCGNISASAVRRLALNGPSVGITEMGAALSAVVAWLGDGVTVRTGS